MPRGVVCWQRAVAINLSTTMSETTPVIEPQPPVPEIGLAPHFAAGIACLFSIVSGAVFLVIERKDAVGFGRCNPSSGAPWRSPPPCRGHRSGPVPNWLPIIGGLLMLVLKFLYWVFRVVWVIVFFVCVIKAFSKQEWEIPGIGKLARRLLGEELPPA